MKYYATVKCTIYLTTQVEASDFATAVELATEASQDISITPDPAWEDTGYYNPVFELQIVSKDRKP